MADSREEIEILTRQLLQWQREYYIEARPSVPDTEYDRAFDRLQLLEAENPELKLPESPTLRVGSDLSSELPEAAHTVPVLSLDKAYTTEDILSWAARTGASVDADLDLVVEEKIDGASIVLYYEEGLLVRGVTRGNGYAGNDVTANIRTIPSIPLRLPEDVTIAVRGEIYLPLKEFSRINSEQEVPYANTRNLAAGTLRRKKSSEVAGVPLNIFIYEGFFPEGSFRNFSAHHELLEYLNALGFRVNRRLGIFGPAADTVKTTGSLKFSTGSLDALGEYINRMTAGRDGLDYEIDGLVIKVNELEPRERLGYTGHHPRWAIAYKFESPEAVSTVTSVDVQVGRTGRITPVARIEPVLIGGSTVSNVTLHNQQYIDLLELAVGDQVAVSKRGDVIPAVERVIEKAGDSAPVWRMPGECPSCGSPLIQRGAHLFCGNRNCPDQVRGRVNFFIAKDQMDIDNLGPETAAVLIDRGLIRGPEDLYSFDPQALQGLPGFGEKKIILLKKGIEESRKRPYIRVLAALGIPDLGQKAAELLIEAGFRDIDSLLAAADAGETERLAEIHGMGEKTAASILESLQNPEIRSQIRALQLAGLIFIAEFNDFSAACPQIFSSQVWCVTGSFAAFKPRGLAMEEVKKRGGRAVGSITGSVTHLLAGEGAGSKLAKAEKLGIQIVLEKEFLTMLEEA